VHTAYDIEKKTLIRRVFLSGTLLNYNIIRNSDNYADVNHCDDNNNKNNNEKFPA